MKMIFDISAKPLLDKFKAAKETESTAVNNMLAALQSGERDSTILAALTKQMEETHNDAMDIWDQLEQVAIGNE
jgi:hypothetical protein